MRITENTSSTIHYATPGSSGSSVIGKRYAASIYGKAESRGLISIRGLGLGTNGVIGSVSTGYVESTGSNTFPVYGASLRADGWGRIYGIGAAAATSIALFGMAAATGGTASYQGDGVSSILMWGAQQEEIPAGSPDCPTSLIPTAASAVTRDADVLTLLDTSRSVEITYLPLAGGAAQIVQVAAGAQPSGIHGWVTRVRQL